MHFNYGLHLSVQNNLVLAVKMVAEFINRESNLDELPEDIADEQGHYKYLRRSSSTRSDAIGDIKYQAEAASLPKDLGTIPYSGEVISTFDSRPINSLDFNYTDYVQWNITGAPPTALSLTSTYNIPGGYIGVLRGYRFEMDPLVTITPADLLLDIFVKDVAQLGYQSLMHGQLVSTFIPCFILADDGNEIKFKLRAPTGIASGVADTRFLQIEFYGNLIQTTGAPLALEIANKEVGLPVKTEQTKRLSPSMRSLRRSQSKRQGMFRRFRFF